MTTALYIVRHGNTFLQNETPRRVGAQTDIPLVDTGIKQAKLLGDYFKQHDIKPDIIFSAALKRTQQTASTVFPDTKIHTLSIFNEIDYGPDENKTEDAVINRIGQAAIDDWNAHAIVPNGWQVDPTILKNLWIQFANKIQNEYKNRTIFVFTSNGIARFAPCITGNFEQFAKSYDIKLKTGAFGKLVCDDDQWVVSDWNVRP